MYKLTDCGVSRLSDMAQIPEDIDNRDWQKYLEWVKEGNTPEEQYSLEDKRQIMIKKVQNIYTNKKSEPISHKKIIINMDPSLRRLMLDVIQHSLTLNYLDINNVKHVGTKEDLDIIITLYDEQELKLFEKQVGLVVAIQLSDNPESIDINTGWE